MPDARRILLVTHRVVRGDGQGRVNLEIAAACLDRGWRVTLAASEVDPALPARGAEWVRLPAKGSTPDLPHLWRFGRAADRVVRARRDVSGEVVLANGFTTTEPHAVNVSHFVHAGWRRRMAAARAGGGPGTALRRWYHAAHCRANLRWERRAYAAAGRVVAVSDVVRDELVRDCGVPAARVTVIPNGIDRADFRDGPADRAALGLPQGAPACVFVGDLRTGRKNLGGVLRAVARSPGLHLAVVGDARRSPFPALAAELGVAGRVRFLGYRRDVPDLVRAADVLAAPSHYEPFGLVVLEALAAGVPVVTSANVGAAAAVGPDVGSVVADPSDVDALAVALRTWSTLAGPGRDAVRSRARSAAEPYTWDKIVPRYVSLLDAAAAEAAEA